VIRSVAALRPPVVGFANLSTARTKGFAAKLRLKFGFVFLMMTVMNMSLQLVSVAMVAVAAIGFMKGAFGGGFAIIGIPVLALVMDPIKAGSLLAPLFVAMDLYALRYWRPHTWSRPDLALLLPGLVAGIGGGYFLLEYLDRHVVEILMAVTTLLFAFLWWRGRHAVVARPRSRGKGLLAGTASGVTTMVAHSGGPPLAMYLLPLGLSKEVYAGTTSLFFTIGNLLKAGPWLAVGDLSDGSWKLMAICLPAALFGVWGGWKLHGRLNQEQLYRICYGLLVVTAVNLLWDGSMGLLR
jgi:uncharacterized membrane protein YfcA